MSSFTEKLQSLNSSNIPYCVLRNFQFLDDHSIGSDVDILIKKEHKKQVTETLRKEGFYKTPNSGLRKSFYNGYVDGKIVTIDVTWDNPRHKGVPTVDGSRAINNRKQLNGCWILSENDHFVHLVFHGVIKKGQYRSSYKERITKLSDSVDAHKVRRHAEEIFGNLGVVAVEYAMQSEFESVLKLRQNLIRTYFFRNPQRIPEYFSVPLYGNRLSDLLRQAVHRVRSRSPPIVAVTGPDGSGKSTLTTTMVEELERRGYDVQLVKLGLTNDSAFIMNMAKFVYNRASGYDVEEAKNAERQGIKTLGPRAGFHKAIVHYLDIVIRWLSARRSDADIVIADRYIHDVGIYDKPRVLANTFEWFESENVYLFLLTGDANILEDRSEYTNESLTELVERYDSLDFMRLDATKDPDTVLQEFLSRAFEKTDLPKYL